MCINLRVFKSRGSLLSFDPTFRVSGFDFVVVLLFCFEKLVCFAFYFAAAV